MKTNISQPAQVDVVIPVFNACEFTRQCLVSFFDHVAIPIRIYVIDNACADATREIVESLRPRCPQHIKLELITNTENKGWIGGINQGIALSTAPYVLMANNDILVYPRAIEEMIAVARSNAKIGMVNPGSNEFKFASDIPGEPPSMELIEKQRDRYAGQWVERCYMTGFFALVKREVVKAIGGLDPVFGLGYADDADYAERARVAGFLCARALGAYVHHFGSVSFKKNPIKSELKLQNDDLLLKRWGRPRREAVLVGRSYLRDQKSADLFCERLRIRLRERTGYIYIFIPRSKKGFFVYQHDDFRLKTYPFLGLGWIVFSIWKLFRSARKKVCVLREDGRSSKK